jgi:ubiquinol-cytochrome c reductase subunit 7
MRDDLIPEDHPVVVEAVSRLTDKEAFERVFRIRRAIQINLTRQYLDPREQISQDRVHFL